MTLGQFFLGMIAICVATFVYRWQKTVDRETSVLSEQRQLYAKYVAASKAQYLSQPWRGVQYTQQELDSFFEISEKEIELYGLRDQIFLIAPDSVVDAMDAFDTAFREWKVAFPRDETPTEEQIKHAEDKSQVLRDDYHLMLEAMRKNLKLHGSYSLQDTLSSLFRESK